MHVVCQDRALAIALQSKGFKAAVALFKSRLGEKEKQQEVSSLRHTTDPARLDPIFFMDEAAQNFDAQCRQKSLLPAIITEK
ncbi:hypothetical protein Pmar_PMAR026289 [Perkinsus marinus ATCC 50983]|uniref:Uncharacterized protein n=1 Tax=Perkinsus marinus (strain ATCC 50983 / TXsc) TaxID=423536 RepID=C5LI78_PERM5|nr:hypothetical protein Pmar_PMAR026289 [Perkinsus marinus ATCC 50983]EER03613.1 hypothetical protein Pmar_PMAR026289 [Perkinsus marinus ATCC 50983]|eukprot:XP_002771797.1 hypothetical protein Pmar_PMAR026289 [Perkinsus marinus ATCC 50983]